jgi:hypothetical protein
MGCLSVIFTSVFIFAAVNFPPNPAAVKLLGGGSGGGDGSVVELLDDSGGSMVELVSRRPAELINGTGGVAELGVGNGAAEIHGGSRGGVVLLLGARVAGQPAAGITAELRIGGVVTAISQAGNK